MFEKEKEGGSRISTREINQIFYRLPYNSLHTTAFWQNASFISVSNSLLTETGIGL